MQQIAFDSAAASAGFDSREQDNWFNCEEIKNKQVNLTLASWPLQVWCFSVDYSVE